MQWPVIPSDAVLDFTTCPANVSATIKLIKSPINQSYSNSILSNENGSICQSIYYYSYLYDENFIYRDSAVFSIKNYDPHYTLLLPKTNNWGSAISIHSSICRDYIRNEHDYHQGIYWRWLKPKDQTNDCKQSYMQGLYSIVTDSINSSTSSKRSSGIIPLKRKDGDYNLYRYSDTGIQTFLVSQNGLTILSNFTPKSYLGKLYGGCWRIWDRAALSHDKRNILLILNQQSDTGLNWNGGSYNKFLRLEIDSMTGFVTNIVEDFTTKKVDYNRVANQDSSKYISSCAYSSDDQEYYIGWSTGNFYLNKVTYNFDTAIAIMSRFNNTVKDVLSLPQLIKNHHGRPVYLEGVGDMKTAANGSVYFTVNYVKKRTNSQANYDSLLTMIYELRKFKNTKTYITNNILGPFTSTAFESYSFFPHTINNFNKLNLKYFSNNCNPYIPIVIEHDTCYKYNWIYLPNGDSTLSDSIAFAPSKSGTYFIKLKCYTGGGFYTWYWDSVDFLKTPQPYFNTDSVIGCRYISFRFNDSTIYDTSNVLSGRTWHWDFGDGSDTIIKLTYNQIGNGSVVHIYTKPGKYQVKLSFDNGFCQNSYIRSQEVIILDAPKPGINALSSNCLPFNYQIIDTVQNCISHQYFWGDGYDTTINKPATLSYKYTREGNFKVLQKLTGASGCVTRDSALLSLYNKPSASLGNDTFICENESIIISTFSNKYKTLWNNGDTNSSIQVQSDGSYSCKISNGLCTIQDTILIEFAPREKCGFSIGINPNPFKEQLIISGFSRKKESLNAELIDALGRIVKKAQINVDQDFSFALETDSISYGMYFLKLNRNDLKPIIFKLVKAAE